MRRADRAWQRVSWCGEKGARDLAEAKGVALSDRWRGVAKAGSRGSCDELFIRLLLYYIIFHTEYRITQ
jgi:hypothetical protein